MSEAFKPKWTTRLSAEVNINPILQEKKGISVHEIIDKVNVKFEELVELKYMNTLRFAIPCKINQNLQELLEEVFDDLESFDRNFGYTKLLIYHTELILIAMNHTRRFKVYDEKNINKIIQKLNNEFEKNYELEKFVWIYYLKHGIDYFDFYHMNERNKLPFDFPDFEEYIRYLSLWKFSYFLEGILIISDIIYSTNQNK